MLIANWAIPLLCYSASSQNSELHYSKMYILNSKVNLQHQKLMFSIYYKEPTAKRICYSLFTTFPHKTVGGIS